MENETVVTETETKKQGFITRTVVAVSESSCTSKVLLFGGLLTSAVATYALWKVSNAEAQSDPETNVEEIN